MAPKTYPWLEVAVIYKRECDRPNLVLVYMKFKLNQTILSTLFFQIYICI